MARCLLDASALAKAVLPEPGSDRVHELVDAAAAGVHQVFVLDLALTEVTNTLWKRHQRSELSSDEALGALTCLSVLVRGFRVLGGRPLLPRALAVAVHLGSPVYDCLYLACAEYHGLVLVTADGRTAQDAKTLFVQSELLRIQ